MIRFSTVRGHTYSADLLHTTPRILDLGANHGSFARQMKERYGACIRMAEANPLLYSELLTMQLGPVEHCAVVGTSDKTIQFNVSTFDEGSSILTLPQSSVYNATLAETIEVPARTLRSLFDDSGWEFVDLVKCDIEGAEVKVLESLDSQLLERIGQITVEFHSHWSFGIGTISEVESCLKKMQQLGFYVIDFSYPYRTDVLLINARHAKISQFDKVCWWSRYVLPKLPRATIRALIPDRLRKRFRRHGVEPQTKEVA